MRSGSLKHFVFATFSTSLIFFACAPREADIQETVRKATFQLDHNQEKEAIDLLESLNAAFPENTEVLEALAFAYAQTDQGVLAGITFAQIAEADRAQSQFLLYAGESMRTAGEPLRAVSYYERYLETFPDSSTAWKSLGEISESLNEPMQAAEAYLRAHQLNPTGEIAVRVGKIFMEMNNQAQAKSWYQDAADRADGAGSQALLGLFEIALIEQDPADAEVIARKLDRDYPGELEVSPLAQKRLELRAWRQKQDELARQLAEQERITRELREKAARETAALAAARKAAADRASAGEAAWPSAKPPVGPPSIEKLLSDGDASIADGDLTGAIQSYWQAIKIDDRDARSWYLLSDAQFTDNQSAWAEATAMEAVRREPQNARYTLHYLKVIQSTKKPADFLRELVKARKRIADSPEITLALARAYSIIGRSHRNAAILYREFLAMAPGHAERVAAEEELAALPGQGDETF